MSGVESEASKGDVVNHTLTCAKPRLRRGILKS